MRQTRSPRTNLTKALNRASADRVQAENASRWTWLTKRRREIVAENPGMKGSEAWDVAEAEWNERGRA